MKKKKFTIILIALVACFAAVLTACQTETRLVDPKGYSEQGYHRVYLYYNGGLIDDSTYKAAYVTKGDRLPSPENSEVLKNPSRHRHNLLNWYQVDADMFVSRSQNKVREVKDKDGNVVESKQVYDGDGNPVTETVFYVNGHDFTNDALNEKELTLMDVEDDIHFDGKPVFVGEKVDKNTGVKLPWNFEIDRVTEDIVLVAVWEPTREFVFITPEFKFTDLSDDAYLRKTEGIKEYIKNVNSDGSVPRLDRTNPSVPQKKGYQAEGFYIDRQCSIPVDYGTNGRYYPNDNSTSIIPIYIKWLEKSFVIVETKSDLLNKDLGGYSMKPAPGNEEPKKTSIYLKSNIDLEGADLISPSSASLISPVGNYDVFSGEVRGNGFTISNFKVEIEQGMVYGPTSYGAIFGRLEGASIRDITFDGVTAMFRRTDNVRTYEIPLTLNILAQSIVPGSVIKNTHVKNFVYYDILQTQLSVATFNIDGYEEPQMLFVKLPGLDSKFLQTFKFPDTTIQEQILNSETGELENIERDVEFKELNIGQQGDRFGLFDFEEAGDVENAEKEHGDNIFNCGSDSALRYEWLYDWERYIDQNNYLTIEDLPDYEDSLKAKYFFVGWYDENGNRFNGEPPAQETRYLAMYVAEK